MTVDASIGISCFPEDDDQLEPLIAKADQAMYAMKRNSVGRIAFFGEDDRRLPP